MTPPLAPPTNVSTTTAPQPDVAASELIGAHWPQTETLTPVRAHRIHWLLAFPAAFLALLFPRRLGPHLAASSWPAALVAHVLALLYAVGGAFIELTHSVDPQHYRYAYFSRGFWEPLLGPPAALGLVALWLFESWWYVALTFAVLAVIHIGFWVVGWLMTPLISIGERPRAAFFRSVKLVLWSTAAAVPLTHAFLAMGLTPYQLTGFFPGGFPDFRASFFLGALGLACWFTLVLRLGARYGGPAQGPRWEARVPRCEDCGYTLTGLSLEGRCPECGRATRDSLPEHRQLPALARTRNPLLWPIAFVRTAWQAIVNRRFAQTVSLWRGQRTAMNFALTICLLVGLLIGLVYRYWLLDWFWSGSAPMVYTTTPGGAYEMRQLEHWRWYYAAAVAALTAILAAGWMCLLAVTTSGFGLRDAAGKRVLICYAHSWLLVITLLLAGGLLACRWLSREKIALHTFRIYDELTIDMEFLLFNVFLLPTWVAVLLMLISLSRMFRQSRFAAA
jgi:hypothetical protein